jgi:hypothetical protein
LHCDGVVPRSEAFAQVELVGGFNLLHVELDAEARLLVNSDLAAGDPEGIAGEALTVLPYPVCIDGGYISGSGGGDMCEHG